MPQFFFTAHTFKCDTKKFYVEEKLILDLGKQPHERKYIKAFLCFIKLTQHEHKKHDNREEKVPPLLNTLAEFGERANLSNYMFGVHAIFVIFILLYLCCVCGMEICVCLLCLIFVNSFYKNSHDESWQLYRWKKIRNYEFMKSKKWIKITLGHCRKQPT